MNKPQTTPLVYVLPHDHLPWRSDSDLTNTKPSVILGRIRELIAQFPGQFGKVANVIVVHKDNRTLVAHIIGANELALEVRVYADRESRKVSPKHLYVAHALRDATQPVSRD